MVFKIFLALLFFSQIVGAQSNWKLKKEAKSIKIYTRSFKDSNVKEFKATTMLKSSMEDILAELLNAPDYFDNCPSGISYKVGKLTQDKYVFYAKKDLPWPIKDRDIVTLLTVKKISENKVKLCLESLPEGLPKLDKTIRIKNLMGHWLLEERNGQTDVTQQLFFDPEGSLPPLIVNSLLIKGPYKTFSELHKAVGE